MDYKTFYEQHWKLVWTAILVVPPAFLALGCILWPEVFWDTFVWKYLWGPIVADAKRVPQEGITEGYNVVNTTMYALVLAVAVIGIWRAFTYLGIRVDGAYLIAMVPYVLLGSILRALEDASLFSRDGVIVYLFISPIIYMIIGILVFGITLWSHRIEQEVRTYGTERGLMWAAFVLISLNLLPAIVHSMAPEQMAAHAPYYLLPLISTLGLLALWWRAKQTGRLGMTDQMTMYGSVLAAFSLYFVVRWVSGDQWFEASRDLAASELVIIPAIAALCTLATIGLFWSLTRRWGDAKRFIIPVSILLFASHFLDGAATYRGIDVHGYSEKHVLPSFLIELTGTALVMLPLKFLVVTLAIYLLDVAYRKDLQEAPNLAWLVKVAIMVLGFAPGMRDMLRLAMGV